MTETLSRVPWYPLAFPIFYGALALFGLLMARHLRVLGAVRPIRPFEDVGRGGPRPSSGTRSSRPGCSATPRAGAMHYAIFAAFCFLSVGVANAVTFGLPEAVLGAPFGGALWAALLFCRNVAAVAALVGIAYFLVRRVVVRPAAADARRARAWRSSC